MEGEVIDISVDRLPDATRQAELDRMLSEHPGSEMTDEQRYETDRISGSPREFDLVIHTDHRYRRGILNGGRYIKSCLVCGHIEEIDFSEWSTIAL